MIELLLRAPLFAAMPRKTVDALAARATRKKLKRGQLLAQERVLIVALVGRIEVVAGGTVIRSVSPPGVFGVSLAAGAAPTAELRAAEACEVIVIPADAMAAALKRDPEAALAAIGHLAGVIGELSSEIEALRAHGLVSRIRHRLAQAKGLREIAITHGQLAGEVGGTRANVSRALARLERDGVIKRRRGRIELL